jgi:hypothetical protein
MDPHFGRDHLCWNAAYAYRTKCYRISARGGTGKKLFEFLTRGVELAEHTQTDVSKFAQVLVTQFI